MDVCFQVTSESSSDATSTESTQKENNNSGGESAVNRKCCVPTMFSVRRVGAAGLVSLLHISRDSAGNTEHMFECENVYMFTADSGESAPLQPTSMDTQEDSSRVCHSESHDAKLTSFHFHFKDKETNVRSHRVTSAVQIVGRRQKHFFLEIKMFTVTVDISARDQNV